MTAEIEAAEAARREAERERVEAEVARSDIRKFYVKMAAAVALPLAFIALIPSLVGLVWLSRVADNNHTLATTTHSALCTFVSDLQRRYDAGLSFQERHPEGFDGLSAADLGRTLASQKATLDSLASLNCPKEEG